VVTRCADSRAGDALVKLPIDDHGPQKAGSDAIAPKRTKCRGSSKQGEGCAQTRDHANEMLETAFILVPVLTVAGFLVIWSQARRHR
jgi:hypothetical protein